MAKKWVRVKDKKTGHEYSVVHVDPDKHDVIDKPAASRTGKPFGPKAKTRVGRGASTTAAKAGDSK